MVSHRSAHVHALTGLRGVAAVLVLLYHLLNIKPGAHPGPIGPGYLAVDLFFILSGYVMSLTYSQDFAGGGNFAAYCAFLIKRFARVWPLYALVTLLAGLMLTRSGYVIYKSTALTNALLIQMLGPGLLRERAAWSIVPPAWSISTEMGAYLLFPFLVALTLRSRAAVAAAAASAAGLWIVFLASRLRGNWGPLDLHETADLYPLSRCLAGFVIGMVVWRVSHDPRLRACPLWLECLILVALAWAWRSFAELAIYALLPAIVLLCGMRNSLTARAMERRPIVYLGEISYALYLVHEPLFDLQPEVEGWMALHGVKHADEVALLCFLVCPFLLAAPLFHFVEKPARRLIRGLMEGRRPPPIRTEPSAP